MENQEEPVKQYHQLPYLFSVDWTFTCKKKDLDELRKDPIKYQEFEEDLKKEISRRYPLQLRFNAPIEDQDTKLQETKKKKKRKKNAKKNVLHVEWRFNRFHLLNSS